MKFVSLKDKKLFLLESNRFDFSDISEEWQPSELEIAEFLKRRRERVFAIKDFRKSQNSKENWRKNRYNIMGGIKKFHKSTEGKRFHRSLSRFLLTRDSLKNESIFELKDILKTINSLETQSLITLDYFMSIDEQAEYELFLETLMPALTDIKMSIINQGAISDEECDLLLSLVEKSSLIKSFVEIYNKNEDEILKYWESVYFNIENSGRKEYDYMFFYDLVSSIKKIVVS